MTEGNISPEESQTSSPKDLEKHSFDDGCPIDVSPMARKENFFQARRRHKAEVKAEEEIADFLQAKHDPRYTYTEGQIFATSLSGPQVDSSSHCNPAM